MSLMGTSVGGEQPQHAGDRCSPSGEPAPARPCPWRESSGRTLRRSRGLGSRSRPTCPSNKPGPKPSRARRSSRRVAGRRSAPSSPLRTVGVEATRNRPCVNRSPRKKGCLAFASAPAGEIPIRHHYAPNSADAPDDLHGHEHGRTSADPRRRWPARREPTGASLLTSNPSAGRLSFHARTDLDGGAGAGAFGLASRPGADSDGAAAGTSTSRAAKGPAEIRLV